MKMRVGDPGLRWAAPWADLGPPCWGFVVATASVTQGCVALIWGRPVGTDFSLPVGTDDGPPSLDENAVLLASS